MMADVLTVTLWRDQQLQFPPPCSSCTSLNSRHTSCPGEEGDGAGTSVLKPPSSSRPISLARGLQPLISLSAEEEVEVEEGVEVEEVEEEEVRGLYSSLRPVLARPALPSAQLGLISRETSKETPSVSPSSASALLLVILAAAAERHSPRWPHAKTRLTSRASERSAFIVSQRFS